MFTVSSCSNVSPKMCFGSSQEKRLTIHSLVLCLIRFLTNLKQNTFSVDIFFFKTKVICFDITHRFFSFSNCNLMSSDLIASYNSISYGGTNYKFLKFYPLLLLIFNFGVTVTLQLLRIINFQR